MRVLLYRVGAVLSFERGLIDYENVDMNPLRDNGYYSGQLITLSGYRVREKL